MLCAITSCGNIKYEKIGTAEYDRDYYNISRVYILYKKLKKILAKNKNGCKNKI